MRSKERKHGEKGATKASLQTYSNNSKVKAIKYQSNPRPIKLPELMNISMAQRLNPSIDRFSEENTVLSTSHQKSMSRSIYELKTI